MEEKEIQTKTGKSKKMGVASVLQILTVVAALVLTVIALVRVRNIPRDIIYAGQAFVSLVLICFGIINSKEKSARNLKVLLYAYALLEALRVVLMNTIGSNLIVAGIVKFVLILLACNCVLVAERIGQENAWKSACGLVILEVLLFILFLIGFPGVLLGHLNRFLPLVGILIAVNIMLTIKNNR